MDLSDSDEDDLFKNLSVKLPHKPSKKKTLDIRMDDEMDQDLFSDDVDLFKPAAAASTFSLSHKTHSIFTRPVESDESDDEKDDTPRSSKDKSQNISSIFPNPVESDESDDEEDEMPRTSKDKSQNTRSIVTRPVESEGSDDENYEKDEMPHSSKYKRIVSDESDESDDEKDLVPCSSKDKSMGSDEHNFLPSTGIDDDILGSTSPLGFALNPDDDLLRDGAIKIDTDSHLQFTGQNDGLSDVGEKMGVLDDGKSSDSDRKSDDGKEEMINDGQSNSSDQQSKDEENSDLKDELSEASSDKIDSPDQNSGDADEAKHFQEADIVEPALEVQVPIDKAGREVSSGDFDVESKSEPNVQNEVQETDVHVETGKQASSDVEVADLFNASCKPVKDEDQTCEDQANIPAHSEDDDTEEDQTDMTTDSEKKEVLKEDELNNVTENGNAKEDPRNIAADSETKEMFDTDCSPSAIESPKESSENPEESVAILHENLDHEQKSYDGDNGDEFKPSQSDSPGQKDNQSDILGESSGQSDSPGKSDSQNDDPRESDSQRDSLGDIENLETVAFQETNTPPIAIAEETHTMSELQCPNTEELEVTHSCNEEAQVEPKGEEMVKCCKCELLSLPVGEMVKMKILELSGRNLALEELVAILEKESLQQREQFTAEQRKIFGLQETIIDFKAQLTEQTRLSEEYQAKCAQVEEALIGTQKMVAVLEEQLSSANKYRSGVDYMLESQLAQGRMAAAEARAQASQHELLQSQDEIKRLLDQLNKLNQEKREMVSLDVHQELMKIADEKAREMELAVLQLKSENSNLKRDLEELKEERSKTPAPSSAMSGYQLGDWHRNLLEQKMKETSEMIAHRTMFSDNYMPKVEDIVPSAHKKVPVAKPTPLMAAMISEQHRDKKLLSEDSDSDWSSDSTTDKHRPTSLPSSPVKTAADVIIEARAALHKTSTTAPPSTPAKKPPVAQKPKLAPKPGLPPKPPKPAKPTKPARPTSLKPGLQKAKSSTEQPEVHQGLPQASPLDPQEKPVSFEEDVSSPSLKVVRRPLGPKGRRRPKVTST